MIPPSRFTDPLPPIPVAVPVAEEPAPASRDLLSWTIKVCLVAALVGFGLTQYLSRNLDGLRAATVQREAQLGRGPADPETTGSIAGPAGRTTLDPCTAGLRLR